MWNTLKKGFNKKLVKKFRIVYLSAVSLIVRLFFCCSVGNATRWDRINGGDCSRRTIRTFVHQIFESDKAIRLLSTREIQLLWGTLRTRMQIAILCVVHIITQIGREKSWWKNILSAALIITVLIVTVSSVYLHPIRNYTGREREIVMKKCSLSAALIITVLIITVSCVPLHPIRNYTGREREIMMKKNIFFPAAPATGVLIVALSSVPLHPIRNYTGRETEIMMKKYFLSCSSHHCRANWWMTTCT